MPPPIKLPHKYSQQDLERSISSGGGGHLIDRDERERDELREEMRKHAAASVGGDRDHDTPLKYDRDDDLDRDSSPTPAEHQASAHYSSSKRKRKNTSSLCDSSMTSTYNFSTTERQSDSGLVSTQQWNFFSLKLL